MFVVTIIPTYNRKITLQLSWAHGSLDKVLKGVTETCAPIAHLVFHRGFPGFRNGGNFQCTLPIGRDVSSDQNLGYFLYIGELLFSSYIGIIIDIIGQYKDPFNNQHIDHSWHVSQGLKLHVASNVKFLVFKVHDLFTYKRSWPIVTRDSKWNLLAGQLLRFC